MVKLNIWTNKSATPVAYFESQTNFGDSFSFDIPSNSNAVLSLVVGTSTSADIIMYVGVSIDGQDIYSNWFRPNVQVASITIPITVTAGSHTGNVSFYAIPYSPIPDTMNLWIDYTPITPPPPPPVSIGAIVAVASAVVGGAITATAILLR